MDSLVLTKKWEGLANELVYSAGVADPWNHNINNTDPMDDLKFLNFQAIWDTGATKSVISARVINQLDLLAVRRTVIETVGGSRETEVYFIDLKLSNGALIPEIEVFRGELQGIDVIIGMDVIQLGDFALTNKDQNTWLTFAMPSTRHLDFQVN